MMDLSVDLPQQEKSNEKSREIRGGRAARQSPEARAARARADSISLIVDRRSRVSCSVIRPASPLQIPRPLGQSPVAATKDWVDKIHGELAQTFTGVQTQFQALITVDE
jgi:hypothetical protein